MASRSSSITTLIRPWTSQSRGRPVIGAPTNFRRVTEPMEPLPSRRRSFRPLELSIYLPNGRISPLPDFNSEEWEKKLPELQRPQAAVVRRETLDNSDLVGDHFIQRKPLSVITTSQYRRAVTSEPVILAENGPGPTLLSESSEHDHVVSDLAPIDENRTPTLVPTQFGEETAILSRPWSSRSSGISSPMRIRTPSPFTSSRARSYTDISLSRKPSLRRSKTDTVDDAIRELNTIVEERRVKAMVGARSEAIDSEPPRSPTTHVPAIAPRMAVRARSQTLSDIGSAFSVAAPNKPLPSAPVAPRLTVGPRASVTAATGLTIITSPHSSISSMGTAMARLPSHTTQNAGPRVSAKSRLSTWFKRSLPGSPVTPTAPIPSQHQQQPFYQLTPPATTPAFHTRPRQDSVSTYSSESSLGNSSYSDATYVTPTTTVASPMTPADDEMKMPPPRPSISKTPKTLRRVAPLKRGLSIDTTLSNGSALTNGPPAYQEEDPHPLSPLESPITPGRVGLAY
jgi:hypothetical protein